MMFIADMIFALFIAMAVTAVSVVFLKKRGPWDKAWMFFAVIFLGAWGASIWLVSVGPVLYGVDWLKVLIIGVLLAAATPPRPPVMAKEAARKGDQVRKAEKAFNLFFLIFILLLITVVFIGYWAVPRAY